MLVSEIIHDRRRVLIKRPENVTAINHRRLLSPGPWHPGTVHADESFPITITIDVLLTTCVPCVSRSIKILDGKSLEYQNQTNSGLTSNKSNMLYVCVDSTKQ